jgi:hypothetical protein
LDARNSDASIISSSLEEDPEAEDNEVEVARFVLEGDAGVDDDAVQIKSAGLLLKVRAFVAKVFLFLLKLNYSSYTCDL